jgi:Zn-finger nucleic acid-binding protein
MSLPCPRCTNIHLDEITVADVVIDRCPRCAGLWFDHAEIGALVGRQSRVSTLESIVPGAEHQEPSLACPRCSNVVLRKLVVEQDEQRAHFMYRCVSCVGTWVDRGELREIEDPNLVEALKSYFTR